MRSDLLPDGIRRCAKHLVVQRSALGFLTALGVVALLQAAAIAPVWRRPPVRLFVPTSMLVHPLAIQEVR